MTLDLPHLVNSVDEYLIKFIQQITMPIRDSQRKLFNADIPPSTQDNQSHVRILYIISLLLFNTNSSCYMPLHYLLTEAILCHGGSTELGIVASLDTSSRLGTHVVEKRIVEGIRPSLQFGMLCIATIDNVDILQSHAVVSSLEVGVELQSSAFNHYHSLHSYHHVNWSTVHQFRTNHSHLYPYSVQNEDVER